MTAATATVGRLVLLTAMARCDAIGKIIERRDHGVTVRLEGWQADGYHLDVTARFDQIRPVSRKEATDVFSNR
jgi:hypothetical protein